MRDYGTGEWEGGDPDCDHLDAKRPGQRNDASSLAEYDKRVGHGTATAADKRSERREDGLGASLYRDTCGKCGATRKDQQLGLEPTPDLFVTAMVDVFREVRRVLAPHGTCFVNLGDSYASQGGHTGQGESSQRQGRTNVSEQNRGSYSSVVAGLKPKDLVGVPWLVAFALRADGWYLRSDIIWAKPNPMPESVTDRPTKSHEYVFLLTKLPRYWFDAEAVREPYGPPSGGRQRFAGTARYADRRFKLAPDRGEGDRGLNVHVENPAGRNIRSVWTIATQPYPEAHFATFPEELARRCILAGCATEVCRECGRPRERVVERGELVASESARIKEWDRGKSDQAAGYVGRATNFQRDGFRPNHSRAVVAESWSDCGHNAYRSGVVLDPFIGSGTVAKVARDHGRHSVGIDLNEQYLELAARRLQQLSLLSEPA